MASVNAYSRNWRQREKVYTARYARQFYRVLASVWAKAARQYAETETFEVDESAFVPTYRRLYQQIGVSEARIAVDSMPKEKDMLDAMARAFDGSGSETIRFIRNLMLEYFDVYIMERLREVSENTRRMIQEVIQQGFDEGLGGDDIARLIRKRAPELNRTRSVRIARTESVTAANKAQLLSHEASPYVYEKAWLPVVDGRTRPAHEAMRYDEFIELWDYFVVGGEEMLAPGDSNASAKNVVNCRCVMRFQAKRDANGRLIRKNNLQKCQIYFYFTKHLNK